MLLEIERVRNIHTHTHRENIGGKKRHFFRKGVKNLVARYTKKLKEWHNIQEMHEIQIQENTRNLEWLFR